MTKYAAFLRGISPTNPNMKNEKLRHVFHSLGFSHVTSFITSGNILFETSESDVSRLEKRIEAALHDSLGISCTTIIRSDEELQQLIDERPFDDAVHTSTTYLVVTFLQKKPESPLLFPDKYTISAMYDREVCSIHDNTLPNYPNPALWIERNYSKDITSRTWSTVKRVAEKLHRI